MNVAYSRNKIFDRLKVQCHGKKILTSGYGQQLTLVDGPKVHSLSLAHGQTQMNKNVFVDRENFKSSADLEGLSN